MRQIVLDTETTGLEPEQGHRIIEIGCIEVINRRPTGRTYHQYVNPDRKIDDAAIDIHGLSTSFLEDKPKFSEIAAELIDFIRGAELIIHNAPFDVGFINSELGMIESKYGPLESYCSVLDTLVLARDMHPGQRNSLDALCKRYNVDNSRRELHGALLDAQLLTDVYLAMTGGQADLSFDRNTSASAAVSESSHGLKRTGAGLKIVRATNEELKAHEKNLDSIDSVAENGSVWRRQEPSGT